MKIEPVGVSRGVVVVSHEEIVVVVVASSQYEVIIESFYRINHGSPCIGAIQVA